MGVLRADELQLSLGKKRILEGVTLHLRAGCCLRVAGPSGGGKTTLLRALAWLIPLAGGTLTLRGRTPAAMGYPQWRNQVMYLPQRPVMFDGSCLSNLQRAHGYRHCEVRYDARRAQALLATVGLAGLLANDRNARELSGGEQQRLQLVRALSLKPAVLLLDEPTASLGPEHTAAVETLLAVHLRDGGATVLVTHDEAQAGRLAGELVVLPSGAAAAATEGSR